MFSRQTLRHSKSIPKICFFLCFYFYTTHINSQNYNEDNFIEIYKSNIEKRDYITIKKDFITAIKDQSLTNEQKIRLYIHYAKFCKDISQYQISLNYLNKAFNDLEGKQIPKYRQEIYQIKSYVFFDWFKLNSNESIDKIRSDSAKYYVDKLMVDYSTLPESEMIFINNIRAHYEYEASNYKEAIQIFDKNIISQKTYMPCELPLTFVKKMRLYNKIDDTLKLRQAYNNSLETIKSCNNSNYLVHTYMNMYTIQNERNNYKDALKNYHLASMVKDSLADSEKMIKIDELDKKYQSQLKDEIISSQKQKEILFAVIMVILGIGLIIYYLAYRKNKKLSSLLKQNNETIEKSLKEKEQLVKDKELLVREVHHRVKNNFQIVSSLLELQVRGIEDEQAKQITSDGNNRIKSMAIIHQQLYQNDDMLINIKDYIKELVEEIALVYTGDNIVKTNISVEPKFLHINTSITLGLIINELVTNAYKYAFKDTTTNTLIVKLDETSTINYKLTIADNGKGLADSVDLKTSKSIGLSIINRLIRQLRGSINYTNKNGAHFEINFKDVYKLKE